MIPQRRAVGHANHLLSFARPGGNAGPLFFPPGSGGGTGGSHALRWPVNPVVFMVLFIVAVLVLGLAIFFYWRRTYGVWAQQRKRADAVKQNQTQTIKYD